MQASAIHEPRIAGCPSRACKFTAGVGTVHLALDFNLALCRLLWSRQAFVQAACLRSMQPPKLLDKSRPAPARELVLYRKPCLFLVLKVLQPPAFQSAQLLAPIGDRRVLQWLQGLLRRQARLQSCR